MEKAQFEELVIQAVEGIPEDFHKHVENLSLEIDENEIIYTSENSWHGKGMITLALYHGVPLTKRASGKPVFPDKITIYKRAIESVCSSDEEIKKTVIRVVRHEVGHYFGLEEDKLQALEKGKFKTQGRNLK
jgi:predicted Zn-dependent protease with MMP-like domain